MYIYEIKNFTRFIYLSLNFQGHSVTIIIVVIILGSVERTKARESGKMKKKMPFALSELHPPLLTC